MNLLVFNLAMDADDSTLGHTTAWTNALARRCDHVSVITMTAGRLAVDPNVEVRSLGKERGASEPCRLRRFYGLVRSALRARRIDACFAHMAPLFTVLFAPVARRAGVPILLWYAHTSVTPVLRLAHAADSQRKALRPRSRRGHRALSASVAKRPALRPHARLGRPDRANQEDRPDGRGAWHPPS
jgi:hypothetical protein